jgi:hypothetical protein
MNKVSLDFSTNQYPDAQLKVKASTIASSLDGNTNYPTLADNVTSIRAKITIFDDYLSKMADGNRQVTAQKNIARNELTDVLCDTGRLVQNISKGDEVMILSSGYDMTRKASPSVDVLDQPTNIVVKAGKISGSLEISWGVVEHARSYELRYCNAPKTDASIYEKLTTPKRKITLEGLVPGQQYLIQIAGVGSDPRRAWSLEITSFVM